MQKVLFFLFIFTKINLVFSQKTPELDSIQIHRFDIVGNEKTKKRIVEREIGLKPNQKIAVQDTSLFLEKTKNKLVNLNLFFSVQVTINQLDNQNILHISLAERSSFLAWPTVMLADRNFNEWWYNQNHDLRRIIYGINFLNRNIGGRAEELYFNFETGFANKGAIIYKIPYIDKVQKTGLEILNFYSFSPQVNYKTNKDKILFLKRNEPLSKKLNSRLVLKRRNNFYERQRLEFSFLSETVTDTILQLNPKYFPQKTSNFQYLSSSYTFEGDHRDNINYPLKGHYFVGKSGFYKGFGPNKAFTLYDVYLNYDYHFKVQKKIFADIVLRTKWTAGQTPPYVIFSGLGFKNDFVRGYDLYVIEGQRFALTKFNLKYDLLQTGYRFDKPSFLSTKNKKVPLGVFLRGFVDYGYVTNNQKQLINSNLSNQNLWGYGLGIDVASYYYNAFRLSVAWNQKAERGVFLSIGRRI